MRFGDLRPLLDAAYAQGGDEEAFLRRIARETNERVCEGSGVVVTSFTTTRDGRIKVRAIGGSGIPRALLARFERTFVSFPKEFVLAALTRPAATESQTKAGQLVPSIREFIDVAGAGDLLAANGYDATGLSVLITGLFPRPTLLTPAESAALTHLSAHAVSALRLRMRPDDVAARLRFDDQAAGDVRDDALRDRAAMHALRRAARALYSIRTARRNDVPQALEQLSPRLLATWSIVSRFTVDGAEHAVVRRNPAPSPKRRELTERERQIVGLVEAGHSLKLVAYDLGISYATVRVLYARAKKKLQTKAPE